MPINADEIQLWLASLAISAEDEATYFLALNAEEKNRALKFKFPIHRSRFIACRYQLRKIIAYYLNLPIAEINFSYTEFGKPYIDHAQNDKIKPLKFNLSHSNDKAVYAFALNADVGVDIEHIKLAYNPAIAKRYFSAAENAELNSLLNEEHLQAFFNIWAKKETLIKAVGKGLAIPLESFSVSHKEIAEQINLENILWYLYPIHIDNAYAAAVAVNQAMQKISYWEMAKSQQIQCHEMLESNLIPKTL